MFSKEEEKQLRIDFWGGLNGELEKQRGLHGNKVNWMNFNTKIKPVYFRMEADGRGARLCIDLQFNDDGIRELFYEQFTEFESILTKSFGEDLLWYPEFEHSNGKTVSRIAIEKSNVNLFKREDWPEMQRFLKSNFIKLEAFWAEFGEVFVNLKA